MSKLPVSERIGRSKVAVLLGRTRTAVLTYHGRKLHPVKDERGEWSYDRGEVERFASTLRATAPRKKAQKPGERTLGETAREVFRAFDQGMPLAEIVLTLAVEPSYVRQLWTEYITTLDKPLPKDPVPAVELARQKLALEKARLELQSDRQLQRRGHRDRSGG